jgi:uncharacterized protein
MKQTFAVVLKLGEAWLPDKPVLEQPLRAHLDYMHQLQRDGALLSGGPFLDNTGGLAILQADSQAEAERLMDNDPAVINKLFQYEIHEWFQVRWEHYEKIRARLPQ